MRSATATDGAVFQGVLLPSAATSLVADARASIVLAVGQSNQVDITLTVGSLAENVEVSATPSTVNTSTQQTSASAQEVAASAQQLAGSADDLNQLVSQFKVAA